MKEEIDTSGSSAKAIILDGSREDDPAARVAIEAVQKELNRAGIHFSWHVLRDIAIAPCTGCLKCWTKTPGECVIDDEQRKIYVDMARSNILILVTPVTFGGYSSELKKGMDRLIPDSFLQEIQWGNPSSLTLWSGMEPVRRRYHACT